MKRRAACVVCCLTAGVLAASAVAQHGHDPLAHTRAKARAENQRVLLLLTGGAEDLMAALAGALNDYQSLGKVVRYEYQLVGLPGKSLAGKELRSRLNVGGLPLPMLAVLDGKDRLLGSLSAEEMVEPEGNELSVERVRAFLEKHPCEPVDARDVLERALAEAKNSERDVFVYLSAPW